MRHITATATKIIGDSLAKTRPEYNCENYNIKFEQWKRTAQSIIYNLGEKLPEVDTVKLTQYINKKSCNLTLY